MCVFYNIWNFHISCLPSTLFHLILVDKCLLITLRKKKVLWFSLWGISINLNWLSISLLIKFSYEVRVVILVKLYIVYLLHNSIFLDRVTKMNNYKSGKNSEQSAEKMLLGGTTLSVPHRRRSRSEYVFCEMNSPSAQMDGSFERTGNQCYFYIAVHSFFRERFTITDFS